MMYRSAITGRFVSAKFAKAHPKTTVRENKKLGPWTQRRGLKRPRSKPGSKEWTA